MTGYRFNFLFVWLGPEKIKKPNPATCTTALGHLNDASYRQNCRLESTSLLSFQTFPRKQVTVNPPKETETLMFHPFPSLFLRYIEDKRNDIQPFTLTKEAKPL